MSPAEHFILISFATGAFCTLIWAASHIAYPRRIVDDQYAVPDDRRTPEQRAREAGQ